MSSEKFGSGNSHICLSLARRSLKAAGIQMARVWDRPDTKPATIEAMKDANEEKLIELHFYFVSIRNIYQFLNKIVKTDAVFSDLADDFATLNTKWLAHNSSAREAFEHIDQRLPGEKHNARIVPIDNRRIHYGIRWKEAEFYHSDLVWDISQDTFSRLESELSEFMKRIDNRLLGEWSLGA